MKRCLSLLMGCLPILAYGQAGVVHDPVSLMAHGAHYGKQIAHYVKQANHIQREIEHYKQQIKYYTNLVEYHKQNAQQLSSFDIGEMTITLRGLLNTVDGSRSSLNGAGTGRRGTLRGKRPYKTIKDWEDQSLQRMPGDFYNSKITTANSQMEAIQIALEFQRESQKQMKQDLKNLERALNDVRTAQGQLQALQAGAKIAADQSIALKQIITLLGIWMEMEAQRYADQANKEAAQEAAWKKQTEFDPGNYVAQPMQLKIR